MKKLIFSLSALAALFLAGSCQRENLEPEVEGGTVTYTVQVPGALATKATGDGFLAYYEVYRQGDVDNADARPIYEGSKAFQNGSANIELEFVKNQNFVVLFWAQKKDSKVYDIEDLRKVSISKAQKLTSNNFDAEVFAGNDLVENCASTKGGNVELVRPIAQLNIATNAEGLLLGTTPVGLSKSYVKVTGLSATYNVYKGYGSVETANAAYGMADVPTGTVTVGTKPYTYVAMNYIGFMPQSDITVDVDFTIQTSEGNINHTVSNVPVKANYKTNIIGNLITATDNYQVILGAWETEETNLLVVDSATGLKEAIENAKEGEEITLTGDIDLSELFPVTKAAATLPIVIAEGKSVVLNLNGYKITTPFVAGSTTNHTYAFENRGVLTIKDTKGEGEIVARGIFNYGKMTLESGTIKACDGNGGYGVRNYEGAEFVMNGGTVATIYEDGDIPGEGYDACPIRVDEGAKAEINGGIIENVSNFTVNIDNYGETIVNDGTFTSVHTTLANSAVMTINGGSFTCNGLEGITAHALWAAAGTTTINGGTFDGKDNYNGFNVDASAGAEVNITGGKFLQVHSGSLYGDGTISVTGGEFFDDPSARVDEGFIAEKNGEVWVVAKAPDVAKIGEVGYWSLNAAVAAVEDGETITLVADEIFTETNRCYNGGWWDGLAYSGDKSFTIDLGGYTIKQDGSLNDYLIWIKNDGAKANTITLKNGTMDAGTTAYSAFATASSNKQTITVNLENINLINNISNGAVVKARGGSVLNVKAGTVITGKDSYVGIESYGATTNIYEGSKIYQNGTSSDAGSLVGVSGNGTVNVYGGEGTSAQGAFIAMTSGGTINISGGAWIANTDGTPKNDNFGVLVSQFDNATYPAAVTSVINVTGGTFRGGYNCYGNVADKAFIHISGGNFNADPAHFLAEGYRTVEKNGVWTVSEELPAAMIGDVKYETLTEAIAAVQEGETVKVCSQITENVKLPATLKNVTIKGEAECLLKDMTISAADGNSYNYENLTFDGLTFYNSRLLFTGWRNGEEVIKNLTVTNCTFTNLYDTTNSAAVHINKDASEAVNGFTFTNNVIDGATGGSKSGVYAQVTGSVTISNNLFNNIVFRPALLQLADSDGIKDDVTVFNNVIANTTRLQIYGSEEGPENGPWTPCGTDELKLIITNNIFKNISTTHYICTWGINGKTDISHNYYDASPIGRIYWNNELPNDEAGLNVIGAYPIYTELNADGTINTNSLYSPTI